jgi:hypothetical protein
LVKRSEEKKPPGRSRHRWEDNTNTTTTTTTTNNNNNNNDNKLDLMEIGCQNVGWVLLAQDRDKWQAVINTAMSFRVPYNGGDFWSS